jgi:hypothetical protein
MGIANNELDGGYTGQPITPQTAVQQTRMSVPSSPPHPLLSPMVSQKELPTTNGNKIAVKPIIRY